MSEGLVHCAVLLDEAVAALAIKADRVYVDATFGRGGHSRKILETIGSAGRLIALDRDQAAIAAAQAIKDPRFQALHASFGQLQAVLSAVGVTKVAGVFQNAVYCLAWVQAAVGVLEHHLYQAAKGFAAWLCLRCSVALLRF